MSIFDEKFREWRNTMEEHEAKRWAELEERAERAEAQRDATLAVLGDLLNEIPPCDCHPDFVMRHLEDPSCVYHARIGAFVIEPAKVILADPANAVAVERARLREVVIAASLAVDAFRRDSLNRTDEDDMMELGHLEDERRRAVRGLAQALAQQEARDAS